MIQMADTALSNGRHTIEERLARWLLLADDRLDNHEIPLTHEFLGVMLGTARPGVTIALQELERRGWIIAGTVVGASKIARDITQRNRSENVQTALY